MDWRDDYKRKLMSAEDAVRLVRSGDRVAMVQLQEPVTLIEALAARLGEVRDVEIFQCLPLFDPGWFDPAWSESFKLRFDNFLSPLSRPVLHERRADFVPNLFSTYWKPVREGRPGVRPAEVFMMTVSPPDENGFCSFGSCIWSKKQYCAAARAVLAEVQPDLIRTFGDNAIHISRITAFVEGTSRPRPVVRREVPPALKEIAGYVSTLVRDGDTFQIGAGLLGSYLATLGPFDDKHDLGYHSENLVPGIVPLVKKGVITGRCKTLHPGKVVATNFGTGDPDDAAYVHMNPMFELYEQEYVININTISAHENMVAINSASAIDFTGQTASESIGPLMYSGAGGQPDFVFGALMSRSGRSLMMLQSTAQGGKTSRIVPWLEPGTIVTVPRHWADYVVTEYGIASLLGKSVRERANELIAVAHPDFRAELRREAQKLFWP
ncbi:MAG: acetyl-CoA hydrolase/transferase family protein [Chloroflexi bacterium]|nr:acetyl-CoA hydrolase/transferase family protein [Chloroflexota bacterium]